MVEEKKRQEDGSFPKKEGKELDFEDLKKKLQECQKQKDEYLAGWQRAKADFINHKREERERIEGILKYVEEDFILKTLPILDNFYLAEEKLPDDLKENEDVKGLLQIKKQILDFLKNQGIEEMKTIGEKFDPNFHEAVETIQSQGKESGTVVGEIKKGYKIYNRLLRPAKVKVAK